MDKIDKDKEPKRTPEDKQVSEVQTEPTPKKDDGPDKGTPPEDFGDKLKTMESELGRLRQELGDEREKTKAYEQWAHQIRQQGNQQQSQQKPQKPNYDEQFFDKPTETAEHLINQKLNQFYAATSQQQAPMALAIAKMQNPGAFDGISDVELQQAMHGGVQSGTTNPALLNDPNGWLGAAWILRGQKTGYTIPKSGPGPMSTIPTETPGVPTPDTETDTPEIKGDDLTDRLLEEFKKLGMTKEEALKEIQKTREEGGD